MGSWKSSVKYNRMAVVKEERRVSNVSRNSRVSVLVIEGIGTPERESIKSL